ncbi:MAG: amidotransferase 1, exosortase A system-associated [Betaproteobacteria bacterium]|nr:amidotransferase 1, exosortase A system-associated [Betaproteobacteria bacterium]
MCGIAGMLHPDAHKPLDSQLLRRMNETLHHRGPDETGLYVAEGVGLAHKRLSIIDLSSGQQPLFNETGQVAVVFNGEIYNFAGLTAELKARGHRFRTRSDTEVIVHAWEEWGERCVERFRGMFAFAVWDAPAQTLFLARDRLGIKPLYYAYLADGTFLFGSELKALCAHPAFSRTLDARAVEDYFAYGYVPEPRTIFAQAQKLSPGYTLTVRRGMRRRAPMRYWDIPFSPISHASEEDLKAELIARLREAVEIRMVAEVPLGAFLSGGVDSSAVVAMMAGLSEKPVETCSIAFNDPAFDESAYARDVARRLGARHHVETVDNDDYGLIDELGRLYDEPFADSSAIPTYRVCELARRNVTVALSGDGGDENFAGYRRYRWHLYEERLRAVLPSGLRRPLFGLLGAVYPKADWAPKYLRAKATFQGLARDPVEAYFHSVATLHDGLRARLFNEAFRRELQGYSAVEVLRAHARGAPTEDALSTVQYLDFKTYLPGDILTKVDRASMAHALEVRVPLLDHPFVEWVSGLKPGIKLEGGEGKAIFKKALAPHLPQEILYRPKKGFAVPLASWFRGPLKHTVEQALLGSVLAEAGVFNRTFLRSLVDQHSAGLRDWSTALWQLLVFESFLRRSGADTLGQAHAPASRASVG